MGRATFLHTIEIDFTHKIVAGAGYLKIPQGQTFFLHLIQNVLWVLNDFPKDNNSQ